MRSESGQDSLLEGAVVADEGAHVVEAIVHWTSAPPAYARAPSPGGDWSRNVDAAASFSVNIRVGSEVDFALSSRYKRPQLRPFGWPGAAMYSDNLIIAGGAPKVVVAYVSCSRALSSPWPRRRAAVPIQPQDPSNKRRGALDSPYGGQYKSSSNFSDPAGARSSKKEGNPRASTSTSTPVPKFKRPTNGKQDSALHPWTS